MSEITYNEIMYKEFGKCICISNGEIEVYVTVDLGPRIIRYGFVGGENEFCENNNETLGEEFKIRGGHRLWHSPEAMPRTYIPDNSPIEWSKIQNGIKVCQPVEKWTQIKKEIEITLNPNNNRVEVLHKLTNKGPWPIEFAAWALSVMAPGGVQIIPQPVRETGLLPNRMISLWPYAKMNDPRVHWGDRYIILHQDIHANTAFKLGMPVEDGWTTYFNHGNLFIKRFPYIADGKYPDYGCSYETYTNYYMMEMESLSTIGLVAPDETVEHKEEWELIGNVAAPSHNEEEISNVIKKYL